MITKDENILVYPYSYKTFPIVNLLFKKNYKVKVATFEGVGLIGKDVAYSVNHNKINLEVLEYSKFLLNQIDILYVPTYYEDDQTDIRLKDVIKEVIKLNKKIIIESNNKMIEEFLYYDNLINLKTLKNQDIESLYNKVNTYKIKFYRPTIPVIYIGGVHDLFDNDYITIALKDRLERDRYKICCISRQISNKVFECINFPDEFININNSNENRIRSLNNYIKSSIEVLNPDVMIIQIPGGMLQFNDYYDNSFGNNAYLISQALRSDYFICCMTSELLSIKHYDEFSNLFSRKYDSAIDCAHYSNSFLNIPNSNKHQNRDILFLDEDNIRELLVPYKEESNYKMLNLFNDEDFKILYEDIINKF